MFGGVAWWALTYRQPAGDRRLSGCQRRRLNTWRGRAVGVVAGRLGLIEGTGIYGRVWAWLIFPQAVHKGVTRLLARAGLHGWSRRTKHYFGGKPWTRAVGVQNLLERDFNAQVPWIKWVSDITVIDTQACNLRLCVVIDL